MIKQVLVGVLAAAVGTFGVAIGTMLSLAIEAYAVALSLARCWGDLRRPSGDCHEGAGA